MTDWMLELADDDLDVLMEALEAWETKDQAGEIMSSLVDAMVMDRNKPPAWMIEQRERDKQEHERTARQRKERSVLLRAKLLQLRDRRRAEHLTQDALGR